MTKSINLRSLSAQLIERVVDKGESLNTALPAAQKKLSRFNAGRQIRREGVPNLVSRRAIQNQAERAIGIVLAD